MAVFVWVGKTPLIGSWALSDCEFDDGFMLHLRRFSKAGFCRSWWTFRFALTANVHLYGLVVSGAICSAVDIEGKNDHFKVSSSGVGGQSAPPETSDREIFADVSGKKRQGKTTKICFGSTKMGIFYREKAFHAGKQISKNDFAPSEKYACYAPGLFCTQMLHFY